MNPLLTTVVVLVNRLQVELSKAAHGAIAITVRYVKINVNVNAMLHYVT